MDSLHVDKTINHFNDDFNTKKFAKQFKAFKDEMQQVFWISLYDTNSILKQLDTLPNEELEQVIAQCNMLIERNTVAEALGIPSAKLNQFVKAYNDGLESVLGELSATVDVLEILNEE